MKKLLVILLLFIFSAQGAVVALGGGLVTAGQPFGVTGMAQVVQLEQLVQMEQAASTEHSDIDDLQVSSSIEEMSDYVALDPASKQPPDRASTPPTMAPVLSSIDLPRALPPPRG